MHLVATSISTYKIFFEVKRLEATGPWASQVDLADTLGTCWEPALVCMVVTCSRGKDQPGKVANPARGELNRENCFFPGRVRA